MAAHEAKRATDLKVIKKWAEERNGKPAKVKDVGNGEGDGLIRIDFPGYSGEDSLEEISWEEWYRIFQNKKLSFLYQEKTTDGDESRFFKFVSSE